MAVSLVAMATATLILFLDVVFELIEERIWFIHFFSSLVDSFCSLCPSGRMAIVLVTFTSSKLPRFGQE